ncbi:hypothetical protein GUI12_00215 [Anaplasmataceae bacterium AB001_6]|nr:hypothetical protein GUI12_00215 [Anaplasmataceae bacterium AB001_6]
MKNFIKGTRSIDEKKKSRKFLYSCIALGSAYLIFNLSDINAISLKFSTPSVSKKAEGNENVNANKMPSENNKNPAAPQEEQMMRDTSNQTMGQGSTDQSTTNTTLPQNVPANNNPAVPANQQPGLDPMPPEQNNPTQSNMPSAPQDNTGIQKQDYEMINDPIDPRNTTAATNNPATSNPAATNNPATSNPAASPGSNTPDMTKPQVQPTPLPAKVPPNNSQKKKP